MLKVLLTGANSYIGTHISGYLSRWPDEYHIETIDMKGNAWRKQSFSGYDSIIHVAGIAHIRTKNLDEQARKEYWQINAVLPVEVAKKARDEGTAQFIFFSSMSVYGEIGNLNPPVIITKDTKPAPKDIYGKSKLFAENELGKLSTEYFRVCILRPPMVYGPGAKGNYNSLVRIARSMPVFPNIKNQRSMIEIEQLSIFIKKLIDLRKNGLYFPQDAEYSCTVDIVKRHADSMGKRIRLTKILNPFVYILAKMPGVIGIKISKAFGSLIYDFEIQETLE